MRTIQTNAIIAERREGNVLVYNGKVEGPITDAVQHMREERVQHIPGGYEP